MKNKFRIVKVYANDKEWFIVQKKFLFIWYTPEFFSGYFETLKWNITYETIEKAEEAIDEYLFNSQKREVIKEICTD